MRKSGVECGIALGMFFLAQFGVLAQSASGKFPQKGNSAGVSSGVKAPLSGNGAQGGSSAKSQNPFDVLAARLGELAEGKEWRVGVGNFVFENTELMSPFSAMLRDELEVSLNRMGRFKVVTRDRLADLQNEGKFQSRDLLEPGTGVEKVSVEGIEGIVRGRFYVSASGVTVFTELVWLEGGNVRKAKVELPSGSIRARLFPDRPDGGKELDVATKPQNLETSLANVESVVNSRLKDVPKEFGLEVYTPDTRRVFKEGERVSFRVRSEVDCHVAVYCHQSDGSTVLLFPNHWQRDTFVSGGSAMDIPGTRKHGFEIKITPPFGSDVVQVLACTDGAAMRARVGKQLEGLSGSQPLAVMTRGMAVVGIPQPKGDAGAGGSVVKWSQAHVVVSTIP